MNAACLELLKNGQVELLPLKTTSYFFLKGKVIMGKQYGASINFPTINIALSAVTSLPKLGCYLTLVKIVNDYYVGLTCLMAENVQIINCETHLHNFAQNIYGQTVTIFFLSFFRHNIPFQFWKKNHSQIITNDLKQFQKNFLINTKWLFNWQKDAKIKSSWVQFFDG